MSVLQNDTIKRSIARQSPNRIFNKKIIVLPVDYWYSEFSFPTELPKEEKGKVKIIKIEKIPQKLPRLKHSYWSVSQGDYRVREKYREITFYRELKRRFLQAFLVISVGLSALVVYWASVLLAKI